MREKEKEQDTRYKNGKRILFIKYACCIKKLVSSKDFQFAIM